MNNSKSFSYNLKSLFLIFVFLICYISSVQAQKKKYVLVVGNVISSVTSEPVIYANIYIDQNTGVSSNDNGNYEIKIDRNQLNDYVNFSAIGFKMVSILVSELIHNPNVSMEEDVFDLEEVVITPLSAFPILSEASNRAEKNFKTGWVSGDVEITEVIFFQPHDSVSEMKYLGGSIINGKINYKGNVFSSVKFSIDEVRRTDKFLEYDKLSEIAVMKPLNVYKAFEKFELYRRIRTIKTTSNSNENKNIFNNSFFKNKNIARIIGFDSINGRAHYLVSTELVNFSPKESVNKISYKTRNKGFNKRRDIIKESLRTFPVAENKDSLHAVVTEALSKTSSVSSIIDRKSYFWIDKENYLLSKYLLKEEHRRDDNNLLFNKKYQDIEYTKIDDINLVKHINTLQVKVKNETGVIYKYLNFEFKNYALGKGFKKISRDKIVSRNHNIKPTYFNRPMSFKDWSALILRIKREPFLKPLKFDGDEIVNFYEKNNLVGI